MDPPILAREPRLLDALRRGIGLDAASTGRRHREPASSSSMLSVELDDAREPTEVNTNL